MAPTVIIKTKKVIDNPLLSRRQLLIDIIHPGQASVSKTKIAETLAQRFKVDQACVIPYGFKCTFGGDKSTGFALIYDNQEYKLKYEPNFRLRREGTLPKQTKARKAAKELKRKTKRSRAGDKNKILKSKKGLTRQDIIKAKAEFLKKIGV